MQTVFSSRQVYLSAAFLLTAPAAVSAADFTAIAAAPVAYVAPQTLTGDWFGQGKAMRDAGFDLRVEWSQFYQGMVQGGGNQAWQYGGKLDALGRFDLSKFGFWDGLSVTVQGNGNYGESVNGFGGSLIGENAALLFPGIQGADAYDMMALYVQQNFGDKVSVLFGKLNLVEFARATPLRGGGGVVPSGMSTSLPRLPAFRRLRFLAARSGSIRSPSVSRCPCSTQRTRPIALSGITRSRRASTSWVLRPTPPASPA
jgi:hypothetical protein